MAKGNSQKSPGKTVGGSQTFTPTQQPIYSGQQQPSQQQQPPTSPPPFGQQQPPQQPQYGQQMPLPKPTWAQSIQQINRLLATGKEAVIILPPNPELDAVLAGLALSAALQKIGRNAYLVSPTPVDPAAMAEKIDKKDYEILEGIDAILPTLPKAQLTITISYNEGSFSEGNMDKTDDALVLTLKPQPGSSPIEPLNIQSRNQETSPDTIFLLGIENLSHLQEMYQQNQEFFRKFPTINIDYHEQNANYATVNLIDSKAKSLSQMVTLMLYDMRFIFDQNISKKLYAGIKDKTNNFAKEFFTPNMLEAVSICMRYQQRFQPKFTK